MSGVTTNPTLVTPTGSLHPIAEHADGGKPWLASVVPHVAVLPFQQFLPHLIEIAGKQPPESGRCADGFTLLQLLRESGQTHIQSRAVSGCSGDTGVPMGHAVKPHIGSLA